jgi:hypothetical protein
MEKSPFMDPFGKLILLSELENAYCQLDHGPFSQREDHPAVDYVVCPLGYKDAAEPGLQQLTIPVCRCCVDGLHADEWTLLFCLNCLANKWILRPIARLKYQHNLIWLGACPECSKKFGGIYFN